MPDRRVYPVLDGGWGWVIVLAACIGQLMFGMICRCNGIFFMQFLERFGASSTATSWVFALLMIVWSGLGPVTTALSVKFGCRIVCTVGGALISIGLLGAAFAPTLAVAYVTMGLILGVGMAFNTVPGLIMVGEYFERRKGLAMAVTSIGSGIGAFSFAPLLQITFLEIGYTSTMMIMAALASHSLIGGLLLRPLGDHYGKCYLQKQAHDDLDPEVKADMSDDLDETQLVLKDGIKRGVCKSLGNLDEMSEQRQKFGRMSVSCSDVMVYESHSEALPYKSTTREMEDDEKSQRHSVSGEEIPQAAAENIKGDLKNINDKGNAESPLLSAKSNGDKSNKPKRCLKLPSFEWSLFCEAKFLLICFLSMSCAFCFGSGVTFLPAFAVSKGIAPTKAAFLISAFGILDIICMVPIGMLFDINYLRSHPKRRVILYCLFTSLVGITCGLFPVWPTYGWLLSCSLIRGIGTGVFMSQRMTVITDLLGKKRAPKALGFQLLSFAIGSVLGRTSGGLFKDFLGLYDPVFYIGGVFATSVSLLFAAYVYSFVE